MKGKSLKEVKSEYVAQFWVEVGDNRTNKKVILSVKKRRSSDLFNICHFPPLWVLSCPQLIRLLYSGRKQNLPTVRMKRLWLIIWFVSQVILKSPRFRIAIPKITEPLPPPETCPAQPVSEADMTASITVFIGLLSVVIQALIWSRRYIRQKLCISKYIRNVYPQSRVTHNLKDTGTSKTKQNRTQAFNIYSWSFDLRDLIWDLRSGFLNSRNCTIRISYFAY